MHAKAAQSKQCANSRREAASRLACMQGSNWLDKEWKVGKCEDWSVLFERYNVAASECGDELHLLRAVLEDGTETVFIREIISQFAKEPALVSNTQLNAESPAADCNKYVSFAVRCASSKLVFVERQEVKSISIMPINGKNSPDHSRSFSHSFDLLRSHILVFHRLPLASDCRCGKAFFFGLPFLYTLSRERVVSRDVYQ